MCSGRTDRAPKLLQAISYLENCIRVRENGCWGGLRMCFRKMIMREKLLHIYYIEQKLPNTTFFIDSLRLVILEQKI